MNRVPFTIGSFDCLNLDHIHLIKEMRKIALPNKEMIVMIPDDYVCFKAYNIFPIQDLARRKDCVSFFAGRIEPIYSSEFKVPIENIVDRIRSVKGTPVFVAYDDNKDFPGRKTLDALKIPIRFIKRPKCQSQE